MRKKKEIKSTGKSELLILISRIMKAQFKEGARGDVRKSHPANPVGKRNQMADRERKGLTTRGLIMKALVVRTMMKRSLIDRGIIETDLTIMSLGTAAKRRR